MVFYSKLYRDFDKQRSFYITAYGKMTDYTMETIKPNFLYYQGVEVFEFEVIRSGYHLFTYCKYNRFVMPDIIRNVGIVHDLLDTTNENFPV